MDDFSTETTGIRKQETSKLSKKMSIVNSLYSKDVLQ